MSQQGGKPTGHEDDWWGQLYDSTDDTGPTRAPDTLDDRFASAAGTVRHGADGAGDQDTGWASAGRAGAGSRAGETAGPSASAEDSGRRGVVDEQGIRPGTGVPAPRTGVSDAPASAPGGHRAPWEPPPDTPASFPPGPKPSGFVERAPDDRPSSPPGGRASTETPPATTVPASRMPAEPPRPPTAPPPTPSTPPRPTAPPPPPQDAERVGSSSREGGPVGDGSREGDSGESAAVDPRDTVGRVGDAHSADRAESLPGASGGDGAGTRRTEGDWWAAAPAPAPAPAPVSGPAPAPAPASGPAPASAPASGPAPGTGPSSDSDPDPGPEIPEAAPPHPVGPPSTQPNPAPEPPAHAPDRDPRQEQRPGDSSTPAPQALRTATRVDLPTLPPAPVGFVGSGPPTYDAEPTALPPADPDELDDLVADTVLDGARYGACTLRAVSVRGDSARFRGEPRRDSLLTARFGTGDQALVLVAMATGARATPGAHRAAAEACHWIGRAVGRSHARLAQDIGAARRGDLKSGLHRLTDRSLGKLRASAVEQGIDPEEYAATLRCLLLPADPDCRIRVFFGVGAGGLFRLRDGEWHDIEPRITDTIGEPVVGFGSLPSETPDGDRLTMDLGIPTPPSPYEPAPEPPREAFRFRASVARPGDTLLMCTGGLADPLRGEPELCEYLTGRWSGPTPPGLAAFFADSQVRVKGYADDRTAAGVWEA
ncbi:protein phosphatase 2C domain-containing protein [Streptomyces sp. A2-16]|uniref:protein phosphatase 2C domain-containing protein n=1 Tax=Streptomyces sp. A2-16 TaxID=2781734 RepID=UPI0020127AD2|nr:protein phosphatase 2C domain-containing protein [Streptomyces sp. A2-16]